MPTDTSTSLPDPNAASPPPAFSLDDAMRSTMKSGQQKADTESKRVQSDTSETLKKIERADDTIKNFPPPPPPPIEPFQPPKPSGPAASPLGEFLGAMALPLAIFGGALTHQPLINAMNAGAMVNDAWTRKNGDDFNSAFAQWQAHTNYAIKLHEYQHEFYADELNRAKEGKADALAELEVKLKAMHDEAALQAYYTGGPEMLFNFLKYRDSLAARQPEIMQKAQDAKVAFEAGQSYIQQLGHQPGTVGPPEQREAEVAKYRELTKPSAAQATSASSALDDDTLGQMAEQYLAGDKSVLSGLGYGNAGAANRAKLRHKIQEQAKAQGMSGRDIATALAEYSGLTAGERSLGTRTAQMGMAVSEAKLLIPQVLQTSAKVDRTQFPMLNKVLLAGEQGTGDPDVVRFGIALNSFINVYARAISPTGTPTVSDKDHARELLDAAWSNGQIQSGLDQITKELEAASAAPGTVRQEFRESGQTGVSQPQIGFHGSSIGGLPPDLPSPAGHVEGSVAKDASGKVVAKIVNGQWAAP